MLGCSKHATWALCAVSLLLTSAAAAVTQPSTGGPTIPSLASNVTTCSDKNVEVCLDTSEGDPKLIDAQKDALIAPETFQPTCQLTFTPIVKGGSISDVFGWYNVRPDPTDTTGTKFLKPTQAELYGMFYATGFKTGADLAAVPPVVLDLGVEAAAGRYTGGQIGFFVVSTDGQISIDPETHAVKGDAKFQFFTQHALNVGSSPTQTYYNVLTWESVAKKNTFYFGWEDLPAMGGDNDFDDFLFSVSGVQCGGGGQPCNTNMPGVCAGGVLQCKKGVIACVQSLQPSDETCNALDDDCDGEVDEGDALCGERQVCHAGVCVPRCGTAEFRCPGASVCTSQGVCVEAACKDVPCPEGKVCAGGECVDSCTGITCPHGRTCRNGGCVDPCVGIECDEGFACVLGVCTSCECSACTDGTVCAATPETSGAKLCVDSGCEGKTCDAGTHCEKGECTDNCSNVVCPSGQLCSKGECIADGKPSGAGGSGGMSIDIDPGGLDNPGGGMVSASGGTNSASGGGIKPVTTDQKACNCSVPGAGGAGGAGVLSLLAALALLRRRRAA